MRIRRQLSHGLALAFLDGEWRPRSLEERGRAALALDQSPAWLPPLCRRVRRRFPIAPADHEALATAIRNDKALRRALPNHLVPLVRRWFTPPLRMLPFASGPTFAVPPLPTLGELASFLELSATELDWFADLARMNAARVDDSMRHYRYRWIAKRSGGARLVEAPKQRMKAIQRTVLKRVLEALPPSPSAHGFVAGRSALTFASAHAGKRVVLRMDLEDFFVSITFARVRAVFARAGYPAAVARALAGLCSAPTPYDVASQLFDYETDPSERFRSSQRLLATHLPQGAPTSPALSNLIAYRMDRRLLGLATRAGAAYSRYADDLAFSGDRAFERGLSRFIPHVAAIVMEEGFQVRYRKTRVMRSGDRQTLAGLVVNERPGIARDELDRLRAILHNAARHGASSQNRAGVPDFKAHLEGRVAWAAARHSSRGARLRALLDRIDWQR